MSIKSTETINKTGKIHQKVVGSKFMFKMSTDERHINVSWLICRTLRWVCDLSSWLCTRSATASMLSSWHAVRAVRSGGLNHGDFSFCSEIHEYIYESCNVFLYAKF